MILLFKPIMYVCSQIGLVNIYPHGHKTDQNPPPHHRPAPAPGRPPPGRAGVPPALSATGETSAGSIPCAQSSGPSPGGSEVDFRRPAVPRCRRSTGPARRFPLARTHVRNRDNVIRICGHWRRGAGKLTR